MPTRPSLTVELATLEHDPYPVFEQVRAMGGIAWIEPFGIWYVVGYQNIRRILLDDVAYSTGTDHSLLYDTFGAHMLTQNGAAHLRARTTFRGAFAPAAIRTAMAEHIAGIVDQLMDGFAGNGEIELRAAFAARLPILSILTLFGFDPDIELKLRCLYDSFEQALGNFTWDQAIRDKARAAAADFHALFRFQIEVARAHPGNDLLSKVVHATGDDALTEEEIIRNASIIFFGGISTVEALLLNTLYASALHDFDPQACDSKKIGLAIDETMRWLSPVQSATRHVITPACIGGITFAPGETVNCMLGAANRDPAVFENPNLWIPGRHNAGHHLGFATGTHFCLGSHLAKLEVQIALQRLTARFPDFSIPEPQKVDIRGFEFRQPKTLIGKLR